jgi:drug/metabolite transporter (DMT)-like permease
LLGVISWTFGTLISSRQVLKGKSLSGIGFQMLFGGLQLFVFSIAVGESANLSALPLQAWGYLAYLILIGSILCFLCFMFVLQNLPSDISGVYAYINPIVALLLGIAFLDEPFTWNLGIGALITVFGVYLVKRFSRTAKK